MTNTLDLGKAQYFIIGPDMCQNSAFTLIMYSVDIDQIPHKVATFK